MKQPEAPTKFESLNKLAEMLRKELSWWRFEINNMLDLKPEQRQELFNYLDDLVRDVKKDEAK